jgi:hypothetical protein
MELSLSAAAVSRRRDSVTTHEVAILVGDYRWNRSSSGRFAGTARRTARAVHAARVTISMNSENGHRQRRRPPRRGVATYFQWRNRHTFCNSRLIMTNNSRRVGSVVVVEMSVDSDKR